MSEPRTQARALALAALFVLAPLAGVLGIAPATARSTVRTETTTSPTVLFVGEENLNVSGTYRAATGERPRGTVTLTGVAGEATGGIVAVDPTNVDVTSAAGFDTGAYSFNGSDGDVHVSVREPAVTTLSLYRGNDTAGAEVTGAHLPTGENVTVEAAYNFAAAEPLEVSVVNENGVEITPELVGGPAQINASGGTLTLDVSEVALKAGQTYTVRVEGAELKSATQRATFTIRESDVTLSLSATDVTQGEEIIGTVVGPPGGTVTVRIDAEDVIGDATAAAARVFLDTGDVLTNRVAGTGHVGAVLDLGDDGSAQVVVQTDALVEENTATIQVATGGTDSAGEFSADADAEADLDVSEPTIRIADVPDTVVIGETFEIEGRAPQSDQVKAYARIGDAWEPLYEEAGGDPAVADVGTNGTFSIPVDSTAVINLPDTYRVGVAVDPGSGIGPTETIADSTFADLVTESKTVTAQKGSLSVHLSSQEIAAEVGDDVTLTGQAVGQGDALRVYIVGPRGTVLPSPSGDVIDAEENQVERAFSVFDRRGAYTFLIVGQGRDGRYAHTSREPGVKAAGTAAQNVAIIREHYRGAGVDDVLIQRTVVVLNPSIDLAALGTHGQVTPGNLTVSGTSNREDGTTVFVEVFDADGDVVSSGDAAVNGSSNQWTTTVDFSGAPVGNYTVRASDGQVTAEQRVRLVEEITTPTPNTPTERPFLTNVTPTPQVVTVQRVKVVTEVETRVVTPTATETSTGQPGFGPAVAVIALVAAALLAIRRR